ncbi:MAG TPA: sugar-binding protein [Planctomycetota bacterium]|nr:sugar-binding protein [Planctomycetota bacterium]
MKKVLGLAALALLTAIGCGRGAGGGVAYVTNGIDPFWNVAAAGAKAGAKESGIPVEILFPKDLPDQKRMVEGLLARGIEGIAISPIDAANQVGFLDEVAAKTPLITHDSDAPGSKRLCFVGMDNYLAGRAAGKLVKEALPEGGKIMIFVGRLEQLNAQQRRQGVVDEVLDRPIQSLDSLKFDPNTGEIKGGKYSVLSTRTDGFDYAKAKANAEDALTSTPDLACMVGLFAYNAPMCLEAIKGAGKVGKVKVVSFDEQDATLQGIRDGSVHGTVSQQPYEYGRQSVRILAGLARHDRSVLPPKGFLEVSIKVVKKDNVDSFWDELKKLRQ